jgi:hypothetical protein
MPCLRGTAAGAASDRFGLPLPSQALALPTSGSPLEAPLTGQDTGRISEVLRAGIGIHSQVRERQACAFLVARASAARLGTSIPSTTDPGCRDRARVRATRWLIRATRALQFARTSGAMRRQRFLGKSIELARLSIASNRGIELAGVESVEPRAKSRQLARGQLLDGFFDVFGCHTGITLHRGILRRRFRPAAASRNGLRRRRAARVRCRRVLPPSAHSRRL